MVIIFDFDGTLADSSALIRKLYNQMAAEHSWPSLNETEYQRLRGLGFIQAQRWAGIKSWQIPGLMREGLKRFKQHSAEVELFEGIPQLITQLSQAGFTLYVLSTNSQDAIREVLDRYQLKEQMTVLKRSALFGKQHAIRHLMAKNKYQPQDVWMVGDEVRDIDAAKRAGVKGLAVSWGLQTSDILKAAQPDAVASHPHELLKILTAKN